MIATFPEGFGTSGLVAGFVAGPVTVGIDATEVPVTAVEVLVVVGSSVDVVVLAGAAVPEGNAGGWTVSVVATGSVPVLLSASPPTMARITTMIATTPPMTLVRLSIGRFGVGGGGGGDSTSGSGPYVKGVTSEGKSVQACPFQNRRCPVARSRYQPSLRTAGPPAAPPGVPPSVIGAPWVRFGPRARYRDSPVRGACGRWHEPPPQAGIIWSSTTRLESRAQAPRASARQLPRSTVPPPVRKPRATAPRTYECNSSLR